MLVVWLKCVSQTWQKKGRWHSPRAVQAFEKPSGIVTSHRVAGKKRCSSVEDVRAALPDAEFSTQIQESIDHVDAYIEEIIDITATSFSDSTYCRSNSNSESVTVIDNSSSDLVICIDNFNDRICTTPTVGDRIYFYCPLSNRFFSGTVSGVDETGNRTLQYDDSYVETLPLCNYQWKFNNTVIASSAQYIVPSSAQSVLRENVDHFANNN